MSLPTPPLGPIAQLGTRPDTQRAGRILLVDDHLSNCHLAQKYLQSAGFENVTFETNPAEALATLGQAPLPDIILLDVLMPEMDGFTLFKEIKAQPALSEIPILFMSAMDDPSYRATAYNMGAVDYVNKPFDRHELVARVNTHLLNGFMLRELRQYNQRLSLELDQAGDMQKKLLPTPERQASLGADYGLTIASHFQGCAELAGDYWCLYPLTANTLAIGIFDFAGHGVPSALETVRLHAYLRELSSLWGKPQELLLELSQRMLIELPIESFATCAYGILDRAASTFSWVGAGAPPILAVPAAPDAPVTELDCSGLPLGLAPLTAADLPLKTHPLTPHEKLIFYSDALFERDEGGWRAPALEEALQQRTTAPSEQVEPAEHLLEKILTAYQARHPDHPEDDLTLVILELDDKPTSGA